MSDMSIRNGVLFDGDVSVPQHLSPNHSTKAPDVKFLIMHYTASGGAESAIRTLVSPAAKVSAHFVLDSAGAITQLVRTTHTAWHAGKSQVVARTGATHTNLNSYSIGIEMVNWGYRGDHVPDHVDISGWPMLTHAKEKNTRRWQPYPTPQVQKAVLMAAAICKEYRIPLSHILGHDEVSLSGKVDPGPAFDMPKFRNQVSQLLGDLNV